MTEPTVQVPESLIASAWALLSDQPENPTVKALDALLSHPTPTAEASCKCAHASFDHGHSEGDGCLHCPCKEFTPTLPRIADMALGTAFTARLLHSVEDRRWMVTAHGLASSDGSAGVDPRWIDPSTIRDMTPPKET